jgi:citrate lyase subunit beta/citryl-CoA lyase
MRNDLLDNIKLAYKNRDLEALYKFASPKTRVINKKNDFRSVLMLSCNNIKHLCKIKELDADAIILNLEDGVSKEEKPFALVLCAIFLKELSECDKKLIIRVNALDDGGYEEITYLNQFMPDAIRVAKIRNSKEVQNVCDLINDDIELHLSIETADAWHNLSSLKVNKRVTTFYLGILDLFADIKLSQSLINRNNPTMCYVLSHFLMTCKTMGIKPVSFVYQEFKNIDEFKLWLDLEKSMGYDAKGCISPTQVTEVNRVFINEEKELKRAKIIVKLFEVHKKEGITGFVDDEYGFIDEPIYKGALAQLKL